MEAAVIDIAFTLTHNLQTTNTEKITQISVLAFEIKQQWQLNKIIVISLVLSATVAIPNMLNQSHSALNVPTHLLSQVQYLIQPLTVPTVPSLYRHTYCPKSST